MPEAGIAPAKRGPGRPPGSTKRDDQDLPPYTPGARIPTHLRLRIRRLYLAGWAPVQIEKDTKVPRETISVIASNEGLVAKRREIESQAASIISDVDPAKAAAKEVAAIVEEIGDRAAEVAIGSLELAQERLDASDAMGVKLATGAAKDAVGIFREARGIDRTGNGEVGGGLSLTVLVGNFERVHKAKPAEKVVVEEAPAPTAVEPEVAF